MILSLRDRMMAFGRLAGRLARDARGNTLAIVAAAIIPLAALVGGGIDMSRGYMAQSRLQQACDAAALAGRRAMTTGSVDNTVRAEALKFFRFNFPTGESSSTTPPYGAATFTPTVTDGTDSAVVITASTTVPTTIMSIFGYNSVPISVNCDAKQDFVNTDIVLVLDTTGSMANKAVSTDTDTKIVALRKAVLALYDQLAPTQTNLESHGLRLRYGVVPYSSSVNVGKLLRAVNTSYVASDNWDYQSRQAVYYSNAVSTNTSLTSTSVGGPSGSGTVTCYRLYRNTANACRSTSALANADSASTISNSRCDSYGSNNSFSGFSPSPSGTPAYVDIPTSAVYKVTYSRDSASYSGNQKCVRKEVWEPRDRTTSTDASSGVSGYTFLKWEYAKINHNISSYVSGSAATPTETDGSTSTWAGCIEERQTDNTITSSTTSIPSSAFDLDISLVPTSDKATKWKPFWPEVEFINPASGVSYSYGGIYQKPQWACPAEAKRMQAWDKTSLSNYLDTLNPDGGTYHDNGIIWGAHIISPNGVFSSDNPNTYNSMPVNRFMIFMTDGLLDNGYNTLYTTYGLEQWDARITPGGSSSNETDQESRSRQRFKLMCSAVKSMGVSIWVVAFASSLDTDLTNCASISTQASTSADAAQLNAKFVEIGKEIGALRLTK